VVADIVVVITGPDASEVDEVRAVVHEWGTAGFVRPFLWWAGDPGGQQLAVWSDRPAGEPEALLDVLADKPYDRIRLVSLLPVSGDDPATGLPELSERVKRAVAERLAPEQRLSTVGILVPASGVADVPCAVLSTRWDVNLVVVDEDGVDPRHLGREVRNGAGDQEPRVRLARCFARAVRSHGLSAEIARTAVARWQDLDWAAELVAAKPAEDSDPWVERATTDYLAGCGERLRRTAYRPVPGRRLRITPRMAMRMLWLFMRGRIDEIRQEAKDGVREEFLDRIEKFTERVVFGDGTDFVVKFDGRSIDDTGRQVQSGSVDLAQALMTATERPAAPPRFPDEWRGLRDLSFGLVDAGELPEGCVAPMSGVHRLVVDVPAVSPAPEPGEPVPDWLASGESSLLSRIGTRILTDGLAARDAFITALELLKRSAPQLSAPVVDRRLWFIWLAICGVSVLGGATAGVLGANGVLPPGTTIKLVLLFLAVLLIGTAVTGFLHLRKQFQAAHKANRVWTQYENARGAAEHEAGELVRLAAAWTEYQDWAPMLATVLYTAAGAGGTPPPDPVDLGKLARPWAFGVATAETNPRLLDRLASIIGKRCFRQGWLSQLYTRTQDSVMTDVKFDRGLPETTANPDPDTDSRARRVLGDKVADGLAEQVLLAEIHEVVAEQVVDLGPGELFSAACPPSAEPLPVAEFLAALTPERNERTPFNRRLWSMASGFRNDPAEPAFWQSGLVPRTPVITVQSVRLDAIAPALWNEFALFSANDDDGGTVPGFEEGVG
jgi:hypothetical protein